MRKICLFLAIAAAVFGESLPLSFEANRGQTAPVVKFLSRGDGYALFLTPDSAVFTLHPAHAAAPAVVRMKLAGANSHAEITGTQTLPGTVNYFLGNDPSRWTQAAATFGKVNYRQIYRGIDLVYYGTQRQLEYDFVVAPGADPGRIALEFSGAKPTLDPGGDLVLTLDGGPLRFLKPVVYQRNDKGNRDVVAASYNLTGDRVRFTLGSYDHSRPLVIDPVLTYLTYLGGGKTDIVGSTTYSPAGNPTQGVAVDPTGNVYVTGSTQSTDFPLQSPIQAGNTAGGYTGFVAKLNPSGSQLIYSTYFGGSVSGDNTQTQSYAIAVDGSGSAYLTGFTNSSKFPVTAGAYQPGCGAPVNATNCPGAQIAFLTKLSPTGSLAYSTYLGYSNEAGVAVAVDSRGQAYIAGNSGDQCTSTNPTNCFPTTAGAALPGSTFNTTLNPSNFNQGSAFVAAFDAAGAKLLYSSMYGGTGAPAGNQHPTFASGVAVDSSGAFYLAGTTLSNQIPVTPGAFQTTYYGNPTAGFGTSSRGFIAKFNPVSAGASPVYATYLGGFDKTLVSYQDVVSGIAADAAGNAYISGIASYDFPATPGANNTLVCPAGSGCLNRGFLAKLNPAGSALVWATFVGNQARADLSATNTISPPRLDAAGNLYVSGVAGNNTQYPLVNPLQPANGFGGVYVTEFDPTGSTINFSTVIYDPTGNGQIFNSGVDVDSQGNAYVAGYTAQAHLPATAGALQTTLKATGSFDGFIAKINTAAPAPTITLVANAESQLPNLAPNTWVEIKGANLSPAGDSRPWQGSDFVGGQMPVKLDGVSVTVNGKPAYVYYISPAQVNILTPPDALSGSVAVQVTNNGVAGAAFTVTAQTVSPSYFVFNGGPYIAATHADGSYIGPASLYPGLTTPAQPGETIVLYANGFGATSTPVVNGAPTQSGTLTPLPSITIGGTPATVAFAGLVAPGEFQFNVVVPNSVPNGDQPVIATYNGSSTQTGTLITVHQ
ncbi:MAG TPA: SBBP repeat-containing protein [Candidatus Sulfopaludibacter sp.]|jgi:uncharacterized protein (TIGR03437 family)|nr:SBBP repeat-containing protein [Candidatus Sulfopaludibacter sp.]